jgi:hypothetical protein
MREDMIRRFAAVLAIAASIAGWAVEIRGDAPCGIPVENGDVNGDGKRDISDIVHMIGWLYLSGPPPCAIGEPLPPGHRCGPGLQDDDGDGLCAPFPTGPIRGAFIHLGYGGADNPIPAGEVVPFLNELRRIGIDTVIVRETRRKVTGAGCGGGAGDFIWLAELPDKLGILLDEAASLGTEVFIGLSGSANACPAFWDGTNAALVHDDTRSAAAAIVDRFGAHPAFRGWYLPDEPGLCRSAVHAYYAALVGAVRSCSTKPIAVSPYLSGARETVSGEGSPSSVASKAAAFAKVTGVDIQIWQDSVGGDAIPLDGWGRPGAPAPPTVGDYFAALRSSLGQGHLWADVELFNYAEPLFVAGDGKTGGYLPASGARLARQLAHTRSGPGGLTDRRVAWLPQLHMSETRPGRFPGSARLLHAYKAAHGLGGTAQVGPGTPYLWETPPSPLFPDGSGGELVDGRTADPKSPEQGGWSGIDGGVSIVVDLGGSKDVDWVGIHVLACPAWGIRIPDSLRLEGSGRDPADPWVPIATIARPFDPPASFDAAEYVLGNETPLNARCARIRIILANPRWTFLSEVEVLGDR